MVRYLSSNHVPIYQPVKEYLYDLPLWSGLNKRYPISTSPLLISSQAYHKSTCYCLVLQPCLQAYYTDNINFIWKQNTKLYFRQSVNPVNCFPSEIVKFNSQELTYFSMINQDLSDSLYMGYLIFIVYPFLYII